MIISVVVTVKNEESSLPQLLDSLFQQSLPPGEIVVCDGGSTDSTCAILVEYQKWLPIKILVSPGATISQGRNQAIATASGEIIAVTDAGVVLSPHWLEELVRPIQTEGVMMVSGWFEPDPYTDFEVVMGATVLPALPEIRPQNFLPSSRSVAFRKTAWEAVGGYPEWLDYGEDLLFDLNLRQKFGSFAFAGKAIAYFRPRPNFRTYARQYYLYARGDGKANLWLKRHLIRYVTYLIGLPYIGRWLWRGAWQGWVSLLLGVTAYSWQPMTRLWGQTTGWAPPARVRAFALIPLIRLVGDVAKMIGYPVGVVWRLRQRAKNENYHSSAE